MRYCSMDLDIGIDIKQEVMDMPDEIERCFGFGTGTWSIKKETYDAAKELHQESKSLKIITNSCQNIHEIAAVAHKQKFKWRKVMKRTKISSNKKQRQTNVKHKSELILVEEGNQLNKSLNIKQEIKNIDGTILNNRNTHLLIESDTEESFNLRELISSRKTIIDSHNISIKSEISYQTEDIDEDLINKIEPQIKPKSDELNKSEGNDNTNALDKTTRSRTSRRKHSQKHQAMSKNNNNSSNTNKFDDSDSEKLNDLQDFLDVIEPKKHKYKPRQKPQLTEEQKEEKEKKKLERRTCKICNMVFAFPGGLRNHMRSKHTLEKPYSCEFCGEQFSVQSSYSLHRRRHLGIKPHLCNLCGKTFLRRMDLCIHMRIHIPSKDKIRDVKCNSCSNVYTSKINLRKHVLLKHTDPSEWKHECNVCNKKCFSATDLTHHLRQHNDDRKFKCVICGRGFFTKQSMTVHVRTHSASTAFNCGHCSCGYRSNEALQRHMLRVHCIGEEKPVSAPKHFCRICKEGFRQRARLEHHLALHDTGEEEYPFECKKCDKRYKARNYFTIHMMDKHNVFIDDAYFKAHFNSNMLKNSTNIDETANIQDENSDDAQDIEFNNLK